MYSLRFRGYVGKGYLDVSIGGRIYGIPIEVRSKKIGYVDHYRQMLRDIADWHCTLLLELGSPLFRGYDIGGRSETCYEDFLILDHLFNGTNLFGSFMSIDSDPHVEIRRERAMHPNGIATSIDISRLPNLVSSGNLVCRDAGPIAGHLHPLYIPVTETCISRDTPENRLVKDLFLYAHDLSCRLLNDSKNRNGYIYPNSDQASAVLDAFRMELDRLGVDIRTGVACREIRPGKKGFTVLTDRQPVRADKVILCTGSKAAPVTGSDGSGYDLAKNLGHRILPVLPALTALQCEEKFFKSIAGVRVNGTVSIWSDGACIAKDTGELQITDYGISGIPVFQVSRYASKLLYAKKEVEAVLDFMPDFTEEQMYAFLRTRANTRPEKSAEMFLIGLFHKKLCDLWIRLVKIPRQKTSGDLTDDEIRRLSHMIKEFRVRIIGTNSYDKAQVCCGGVDTREIDQATLESVYVPGLYFAGEILDVDGMCGGYNLTFAWASGYAAGMAAAAGEDVGK